MPEQITTVYQLFQKFSWSELLDIKEGENYVKIADTEEYLVKKEGDFLRITFFDLNKDNGRVEKRKDYITLSIHTDINPIEYINYWINEETNSCGYNFSKEHWIFKKVFEGVDSVKVSNGYQKEIQKRGKTLLIKSEKFKELQKNLKAINQKASSSKTSLLNFLVNQAKFKFLNKHTKRTTSSIKGDFDFLIHRFNLATKKKQKDFLDRLRTH